MKKALVLGVLAIFAIGIANVNAQDRTNVQQKPQKTYTKEPASKNVDTKAINSNKAKDPATKNVSVTGKEGIKTVKGTKGGNKVSKPTGINEVSKKSSEVKPAEPTGKVVKDVTVETPANEKKTDKKEVTGKTDVTSKQVATGKKINNSVPPTPKEKKTATGSVNSTVK